MDVGAGRAGGSSVGAGHKGSVPSTTCSHNPPTLSSTTLALAGGLQLKGNRWESGTSFSTTQTGGSHGWQGTPPLTPVWPPRPTSSAGPSASARSPAPPPGLETTRGNTPSEIEEEQGNYEDNKPPADSSARGRSIGITRESDRSARQAIPVAPLQTGEDGTTAVATAAAAAPLQQQAEKQKQELRQLHESKQQGAQGQQQVQMTLSSLLSSPSLLCRTHSTHPTTGEGDPCGSNGEDNAGGGVVAVSGGERNGGGGGGGGNYRSVCSCPAIGATATSPLFARHELTDRSALERSQRLVSWWGLQRSI